jgi:hypothetical protein
MTDIPPASPVASSRLGGLDGFLALQAVVVIMLGVLAVSFVRSGDPHDAALVATGLIGALAINRKSNP